MTATYMKLRRLLIVDARPIRRRPAATKKVVLCVCACGSITAASVVVLQRTNEVGEAHCAVRYQVRSGGTPSGAPPQRDDTPRAAPPRPTAARSPLIKPRLRYYKQTQNKQKYLDTHSLPPSLSPSPPPPLRSASNPAESYRIPTF